jgi:hypothetical protein
MMRPSGRCFIEEDLNVRYAVDVLGSLNRSCCAMGRRDNEGD